MCCSKMKRGEKIGAGLGGGPPDNTWTKTWKMPTGIFREKYQKAKKKKTRKGDPHPLTSIRGKQKKEKKNLERLGKYRGRGGEGRGETSVSKVTQADLM